MNVKIDTFKGMAPKINKRRLGNSLAQSARDCYLKSGALESIKSYAVATNQPTKSGDVLTIYGFDRDANDDVKWLQWSTTDLPHPDGRVGIVEVAKGFVVGDADERYYYTGTDVPRETTTTLAMTGVGTNYPLIHYKLGTPNPPDTPESLQTLPVDSQFEAVTDCSTLENWITSTESTTAPYNSSVTVVSTGGNPGPYFKFVNDGASDGGVPYAYIQASAALTPIAGLKQEIKLPTLTDIGIVRMGVEASGINGFYVSVKPVDPTTINISIGTSYAWGTIAVPQKFGATVGGLSDAFDWFTLKTVIDVVNQRLELTISQGIFTTSVVLVPGGDTSPIIMLGNYYGYDLGTYPGSFGIDTISFYSAQFNDPALTNYVYTWVSEKDGIEEESAPTLPSGNILSGDDLSVEISNINDPTPTQISEYNITKKYLYRAVSGSSGTVYQFVAEIPLGTTVYADSTLTVDLEKTFLESIGWQLPPTDGRNITALPNGIMLITSGRDICPSASFRPHAYPLEYRLSVDYDIVGIGVLTSSISRNNEGTAVIVTEGGCYIITGDNPASMVLAKVSGSPGGYAGRSIAYWRKYGVLYSSLSGLIAITTEGALNLTENFADNRAWANYDPKSTIAAVSDETYFGFKTTEGYTFDPNIGLVDISPSAQAVWEDTKVDMFYYVAPSSGNQVRKWGAGSTNLTAVWKSGVLTLPYPTAFEAGQVHGNPLGGLLNLYSNGSNTPYFIKSVASETEFVVNPKVNTTVELELTAGTSAINSVELVEDLMDLT